MYERRTDRLLSRGLFARRMARHGVFVVALVVFSLGAGMWGYEYFESLPWRDSFLNTAMLLGGMGPVDPPHSDGGKIFAGVYALYAGLVFIVSTGVLAAPVLHRLMHRFHWSK